MVSLSCEVYCGWRMCWGRHSFILPATWFCKISHGLYWRLPSMEFQWVHATSAITSPSMTDFMVPSHGWAICPTLAYHLLWWGKLCLTCWASISALCLCQSGALWRDDGCSVIFTSTVSRCEVSKAHCIWLRLYNILLVLTTYLSLAPTPPHIQSQSDPPMYCQWFLVRLPQSVPWPPMLSFDALSWSHVQRDGPWNRRWSLHEACRHVSPWWLRGPM